MQSNSTHHFIMQLDCVNTAQITRSYHLVLWH